MSALAIAIVILCGVLGLLIGSFLNVVIYRVPAGISIVSPPSACPGCGRRIKPYDNIPVLSWLLLRARCRSCGEPISARYPLVELLTGVLFAAVALLFVTPLEQAMDAASLASVLILLAAALYLAAISVALAFIDLDTHTLPNTIVLPSYIVVAILLTAAALVGGDWPALLRAAIGGAVLFGFYLLLAFVYPKGMGFGDVKLAGVIGLALAWAGWGSFVVGAFSAYLLGGVFAIGLLVARRVGRKGGIPFGPWMLAGAWVGIFFGQWIWNGYLSAVGLA